MLEDAVLMNEARVYDRVSEMARASQHAMWMNAKRIKSTAEQRVADEALDEPV